MTFRSKLLLAMALIVAGVSVAVLLVIQRRVEVNYERMFRNQFERQITFFTALQESRLGAVRDQCLKLSESSRLISALSSSSGNLETPYRIAGEELREVLGDLSGDARRSNVNPILRQHAAIFCFLDAQGKMMTPPDTPRTRQILLMLRNLLGSNLGLVQETLASVERQQVGYLALELEPDEAASRFALRSLALSARAQEAKYEVPTLREVIVTKVMDSSKKRTLGWLVLGFTLPNLVPELRVGDANPRAQSANLIQTGILLEDKLYAVTNVISESLGQAVGRKVKDYIRLAPQLRQADFSCVVDGQRYRVFYELMNERSAFPRAYQICLFSMAEVQREQHEMQWQVLSSAAVALAVALLICMFLSHGLSAPIRDLVKGTGEIQRGNLEVRVPVRSRDELGQLAGSFNEMTEGLAQKEKYRTVLNMVADEKVAQQLVAGRLTLGGELREISVLFCDIRGFTALTQNMPPGEVIEMLNEHMTALTRVVKEHQGVLDKFVGDLLMAVFGAPIEHGDDTLNAVRCALRLMEERATLNLSSRHQIQIGIGLATGTVVAGCMGSVDRLNYTVLGERVNLASRLCGRARAGEVLVDHGTVQKLDGCIEIEPTGEIELKGFSAPVKAFRLLKVSEKDFQGVDLVTHRPAA